MNTKTPADTVAPDIRAQVERFMADPERCMPSERQRLEDAGFKPTSDEKWDRLQAAQTQERPQV